jgi:hypothetical protein
MPIGMPVKYKKASFVYLQTQTLNLLVVVQGQCTMGCAADESGRVFSALKLEPLARRVNPNRKS